MRLARLCLVLAAAALLAASLAPGRPQAAAGSPGDTPRAAQPAPESIQTKGRLVPKGWASLSFPTSGRVAELLAKEGEAVPAGSTLARLEDLGKNEARVAAAELELIRAKKALDDLHQRAGVELALAGKRLAEARKAQDTASWKLKALIKPVPEQDLQAAQANLLLLEKRLERAHKDLRRLKKLWKDDESPFWWFVSRHAFKLNLVLLRGRIAQLEGKYDDGLDRYDDLKDPVDAIDLQQAEADLAAADTRVEEALRDRQALSNGPDPDELALALARLRSAQEALRAAQAAIDDTRLLAPFDGQVVSVPAKAGEWIPRRQPVLVLADLSGWEVEIRDLEESDLPSFQEGQAVQVTLDALPGEALHGRVESISLINGEKDGKTTYTVKIALDEGDSRFRWGMTARVRGED